MVAMKRTLGIAVGVLFLALSAGSASALSSVNLIWKSSGTDTLSSAEFSGILFIVLQGDSPEGIGGVFVTILFDTAELDFGHVHERSGASAKVGMGNQFAPLSAGVTVDEVTGTILGFDSASIATGCIGCTITLGSVLFWVTAPPADNDGPNDVRLAVLPNGIDAIVSAAGGSSGGALTTASFGNAEILPEPTTGLLIVGGLLGLGYSGRRSAR